MKKFTHVLLAINVVIFSWLVMGARKELPPWQKAFDDARFAINNLDQSGDLADINQAVLHGRVQAAEDWARITIREYKRSNAPLGVLTVINIIGLAVIASNNRKVTKTAHPKADTRKLIVGKNEPFAQKSLMKIIPVAEDQR